LGKIWHGLGAAVGGERVRLTAPIKVAIVATHPIQYQVPWFCALAARPDVQVKVYFAMLPGPRQQGVGFGTSFEWDIPMLEGYLWEQLPNARREPGLSTFFGSSTPGVHAALGRDRPDAAVVTGWNALPLLQALWACMRLGIPRIARGESNALKARTPAARIAHRVLLPRFNAFLAIGKANRDFYLRYGIPESSLFDAPYFVDNARFRDGARSLASSRNDIRSAWGVPEKAVCFLFAGKLQPKKRIFDLLRAMQLLQREAGERHLLVIGSGEQQEEASTMVARERLPVTFAGFLNQSEMPRAYVAADCLVLPSGYGETWGLVVNEAMACGLPAIVSDRVGCGPDLIVEGRTGYAFPFEDAPALAARMMTIARDDEARTRMGKQALEHIDRYSVHRAVEGTIAAVRSVIGRAG